MKMREIIDDHALFRLFFRGLKILWEIYILSGFSGNRFKKIKQLKNKHKGQRCFIIATGPSLNIEDIEMLRNEICFSCNSIIKVFEKTVWRPDYYVVIDVGVYKALEDEISKYSDDIKYFFHPFQFTYYNGNSYPLKFWRNWCVNPQERKLILKKWRRPRIGLTKNDIVYEGASVVHVCMQLAIFMGFKEIYLLGTDCNYYSNEKYSQITFYNSAESINSPEDIYNGLMEDYKFEKNVVESREVVIYNATRGGMLELFDRVDLDNIINKD
jgi:hypothetical protein